MLCLKRAVASTTGVNITNLAFYLAIEKNQEIVNHYNKVLSPDGIQILTPFVYRYKVNPGTGSTHSLSFQ